MRVGPKLSARSRRRGQRGVVLVICLLLLLILTIVSGASMNMTVMQEKMAANYQLRATSFQIAESAIQTQLTRPLDSLRRALTQTASGFEYLDDLGRRFDPVPEGPIRSNASALVRYCGERVARGTGMNAERSIGAPKYMLHVLQVRGEGRIDAVNAKVSNERRVGALLAGRGLLSCPPEY